MSLMYTLWSRRLFICKLTITRLSILCRSLGFGNGFDRHSVIADLYLHWSAKRQKRNKVSLSLSFESTPLRKSSIDSHLVRISNHSLFRYHCSNNLCVLRFKLSINLYIETAGSMIHVAEVLDWATMKKSSNQTTGKSRELTDNHFAVWTFFSVAGMKPLTWTQWLEHVNRPSKMKPSQKPI